jgi:hypothetical protein
MVVQRDDAAEPQVEATLLPLEGKDTLADAARLLYLGYSLLSPHGSDKSSVGLVG